MFFDWLNTIEIDCDAPPYSIVKACRALGFWTPEDVRWCQMSILPQLPPKQWRFWHALVRKPKPAGLLCRCGRKLPALQQHTLACGSESVRLSLAQCRRCNTIFWNES